MRITWLVTALIFLSIVAAGTLYRLTDSGTVITFAKRLDDLIDARMAATLAGLSLAAASFTRDTPRRPGEDDASHAVRHKHNARATWLLVSGFYVFTAVLALGLSFDPLFDPTPVRSWVDLIGWIELLASTLGTCAGLGFLVAGAHGLIAPE